MPLLNSILIKEKIQINNLTLILEENDNILESIKQGMKENNICECNIIEVKGYLKKGLINYMDKHKFKSHEINNQEILKASGNFKYYNNELFGKLNIFANGKKPICATLSKGIAKEGFTLIFSFIKQP